MAIRFLSLSRQLCENFTGCHARKRTPQVQSAKNSFRSASSSHSRRRCLHLLSREQTVGHSRRSQGPQESSATVRSGAQVRQSSLRGKLRQLSWRQRQGRRLRSPALRSQTSGFHRRPAHEHRHRRRALLPNQPGQKAYARVQEAHDRRSALAARPARPLFCTAARLSREEARRGGLFEQIVFGGLTIASRRTALCFPTRGFGYILISFRVSI